MSTNGASLEDCHTNVFVLTELNGLKWKKFTCGQGSARGCTEIGEDAVLRAYGRCLSDNMLCAWRRVPGGGHGYPGNLGHKIELRLDAEKELWVFWYAEEPDNLESFTKTLNLASYSPSREPRPPCQSLRTDCGPEGNKGARTTANCARRASSRMG
uniref:Mediator of RNA polymerase II transcription subunit 13 n=1 Tax=Plectus sambesii TaxID=2011161 RepID=A0A914US35_9BILA